MADNLIFPVKFDLSKAVSDATGDLETAMRRLQTMINSQPLAVNLKIDGAGGGSINEITDRMKELSAQWKELSEAQRITNKTSGEYTDEAKQIINEYVRLTGASQTYAKSLEQIASAAKRAADAQTRNIEKISKKQAEQFGKTRRTLSATENSIKGVSDKLKLWQNALNSRDIGTRQFERAAKEVQRLTSRLEELKQKTTEATGQTDKINKTTDAFRTQDGYVSRLIKRLAVYASFSAVGNFFTNVREVTAQFELQRISLGAILQDTEKANQLFGQLKAYALQSPVKFMDLTKYTKQLAAYKIGYDELFETTKRLTDISVGLGVSMDRIILMYGQIRATGYLRACLGKDTPVKMFDGSIKAVQDIKIGNLLMGDDEKPRIVSKLHQGQQQMYRVKYADGEFRCNEHHKLTLYNTQLQKIEDVYVFAVYGWTKLYKGVKRINGKYEYFDFELIKDNVDDYFGFSIDGNKRFVICDNVVTHNSEVRQATEAGIPLVEELAKKLSAMRGEMVSAADVMDMISKRAISFELVKEVFNDMTNAGGIFYNMQEKQGNTLYGMWQKLGDAASMMYDEIGNTAGVNWIMKTMIQAATSMMKNWGLLASELAIVGSAYGLIAIKTALSTKNSKAAAAWSIKLVAAKAREAAAVDAHNRALSRNNLLHKANTSMSMMSAKAATLSATQFRAAALSTSAWNAAALRLKGSLNALKATLLSNPYTAAIAAIAAIGAAIYSAYQKANKLRNELESLKSETSSLQTQSVNNLTGLWHTVLQSPANSKKQLDALNELKRTYGDIIPVRDLTIETLKKEGKVYEKCTAAIREYIAQQQLQKGVDKINEDYASKILEAEKKFKESIQSNLGATDDKMVDRIIANVKEYINAGEKQRDAITKALTLEGYQITAADNFINDSNKNLLNLLVAQKETLEKFTQEMSDQTGMLGKYVKSYETMQSLINNHNSKYEKGTWLYSRETTNYSIRAYKAALSDVLGPDIWDDAFADITKGIGEKGDKMSEIFFDKIWKSLEKNAATPQQKNFVQKVQNLYNQLIPQDVTVQTMHDKLQEFTNEFGVSMNTTQHYMMTSEENISDYAKKIKDHLDELQTKLKEMNMNKSHAPFKVSDKDIANLESEIKVFEALAEFLKPFLESVTNNRSSGTDDRLSQLREMESSLSSIYKKYTDLSKSVGAVKALDYVTKNYASTLKDVNRLGKRFGLSFTMPTSLDDLNKFREQIKKTINDLRLKGHEKAAIELELAIAEGTQDKFQKELEKKLNEIANNISRTKAAKEFFDKILSTTGNENLAERLASSIFGQNGSALNKEIANQLREMVTKTSVALPDLVFYDDNSINSKALRSWVALNKEALGDVSKDLLKFADDAENNAAKQVEGWIKATEKAKEYGDKLADVYRTTNAEIKRIQTAIEQGGISKADGEALIANFQRKRDDDITKLQYEAFKDSPVYTQMFADLDNASTAMLKHMKNSILEMQSQWSNLNPTQLKELQSRLKEIDKQLTVRNPFKSLADGMREYTKLRTKGDARGNKSRSAADQDVLNWTEKYLKAQEELAKIQADEGATEVQIAGAAQMVTYTKKQKEEAEKVAENWNKVEDAIGMSLDKLLSTLNWAGDIVGAIADVSEVMGADEEDVQYWNDIADSLGQISGGIQDIVKSVMSGDVVGMISSVITATPKMFIGFVNLFSAGKVRKANKEIRKQAELLEDLEYAYSRLESAMDKAFGGSYLSNYQKRLKNLQAQQAAYEKQADAERSKGKKEDKAKTEEYLNSARETADEIAEMQSQIAERMLGTDITSAAREFAQAWLDAYKEFGNTADAMSEKFNEMIQNMIIESVLAAAMEKALQPVFDMIDEMQTGDIYSKAFWNKLTDTTSKAAADADAAGKAVAAMFESMGISVHEMSTDSTGIAKDVSSATSEEINALAAIGNTLMYYVSPIPRMDENLAAIRSLIENGSAAQITTVEGDRWTDWQQQAMDNYNAIARNTADTVAECRRAAIACEAATEKLNKAFKTKGSKQGFSVFMD